VKYRAVIFDLGGTLVHYTPWSEYVEEAKKVAAAVSAPVDDFVRVWFEHSGGLGTGDFPSFQAFISHVSRQLSLEVPPDLIDHAAGISISMTKRLITVPRDGAMEVLSYLKTNGYKTGLITDCSPDVPELWPETPFAPYFDVVVFSCEAGMNKGDPRIFQIALEQLAIEPVKCIYVADGMRNELTNAAGLGMTAVQLLVPEEIDDSPIREKWHGQTISSLKGVLDFLI
jgi:putative hydrolase of the HAD superfamily